MNILFLLSRFRAYYFVGFYNKIIYIFYRNTSSAVYYTHNIDSKKYFKLICSEGILYSDLDSSILCYHDDYSLILVMSGFVVISLICYV